MQQKELLSLAVEIRYPTRNYNIIFHLLGILDSSPFEDFENGANQTAKPERHMIFVNFDE